MLYLLAKAANNINFLKLYSVKDSIDQKMIDLLKLSPDKHIFEPSLKLFALLDSIDLPIGSEESSSQDDESGSEDDESSSSD